jgi:cellulose synthase/poly-beta-1,6-N-acetylglucosamine synthase-like glycosyltransferase/spore germination protein YaaH/peptidoglycan/xylan/chitin deacetylase (PgdA/CDA1 family)
MSDHAVFFDPSHKRWWWIKRIGTVMGLMSVIVVSTWLVSLFTVPLLPGIPGITLAIKRSLRRSINFPRHQTQLSQFLLKKYRENLLKAIAQEQKVIRARAALPPIRGGPIVAAFYAPWQETGLHSLRANADRMTHVLPSWAHLAGGARGLDFHDWDPILVPHNKEVIEIARTNSLNLVPVFSNAQVGESGSGEFEPQRAHVLLNDPAIQAQIITQLRNWCLANRFQGINVDFENLFPQDYPLLVPFLRRMRVVFAPNHLSVSIDLEASTEKPLNWREVANVCDFVVIMAYDEHSSSSAPGPIASINWYRTVLQRAVDNVPREKLVIGLANYAYDWMAGRGWAEPLTYQGALLLAKAYRVDAGKGERPEDVIDFDDEALNPTFWYVDDNGKDHEVWMLDAVTAANQWSLAQNYGLRGVAVWVLGSSDPSIWTFIHRDRMRQPPDWKILHEISYPYDVEFVGDGEISYVDASPTKGSRSLEIDQNADLALDESYHTFPTSYVIRRSGYHEKWIALTIDDGPSALYTPDVLDELKRLNVKATFFLIGQNAERNPGLVKRIFAEGHEIGNHTFTHPNIGALGEQRAKLELNATQRVFQALIRRSTLLFRPPYNADAEPTSAEEVRPLVYASSLNYITVLEFIDPQDWNLAERLADGTIHHRTAQDMLQTLLPQLTSEKGSMVLLHDAGGDRSETIKLIPLIVTELSKQGYKFVTVSQIIGVTRDQVMPPVTKSDTLMLASDRLVFEFIYLGELFLGAAFVMAIVLGALRVFFVITLALIDVYKTRRRPPFDESFRPPVTVVIAAFNEAKVITRTIRAVLANEYEPLDVIVVDDGSQDDTSGAIARELGEHPRVRVFRQENGGKASALNHGIGIATGEIIIALDADTIFARDTIVKLVRHFADPLVGAVAGNVKVGNRVNPLTYWQSIEYVTSQNLDRRAYAQINSVTVVPGAVGAWRREAILQAGGYTTDTMAEDMDLTWRIRRIGWRIDNEAEAIGYTEAPDSIRNLFKQRFRWAFGTLQCLWKHRRAVGRYGWFGKVMLPTLWLFQIFFQVLSPLIDLEIIWTLANVVHSLVRGQLTHDWQPLPQSMTSLYVIGFMYAFFFVIELMGALVAYKLDREDPKVLVWLFWQRFLYRQLMYAVLLKSLKTALSGIRAGWGKLERKGTVELIEPTMSA